MPPFMPDEDKNFVDLSLVLDLVMTSHENDLFEY